MFAQIGVLAAARAAIRVFAFAPIMAGFFLKLAEGIHIVSLCLKNKLSNKNGVIYNMENTSYGNIHCKQCGESYPRYKIVDGTRKWGHRKFCSKCLENQPKRQLSRISDEQFREAISQSKCVREVLIKLDLKAAGGNYAIFHQRVKSLNIDTSHFSGAAWATGKNFGPKRPIEDYLSNKHKISSSSLKRRLIKEGLKEPKCECCQLDWWIDKEIPLELHHINGNHFDNSLENLQLLCPNCHANTENYRGRNQERSISKEIREIPSFITEQKDQILIERRKPKVKMKKERLNYQPKTKINWPSDIDLLDIVWNGSVASFAKKNGISDSAVKHRLSRRNMPSPPPGFFRRKETGKNVSSEWQAYLNCREKMVALVGPAPTLEGF